MPSTEISSTCLLTGAGACAAALAEPCNADNVYAAAAALAARHAKVFRLVTGTPDRADLFGAPVFLSSQGEIRVLVRKTTRELIEATCRFLATSREFGATSTNYPGGARGQHLCRRGRRSRGRVVRPCNTMPQRRHSRDHAAMMIVYLRTQNRLTCIWSAMRGGAVPGRTKSAIRTLALWNTNRAA